MKIGLDVLYELSFLFGTTFLPKIFKALGLSDKVCTTASGHSNMWTGVLLGAGGAFIVMGAVAAIVSGGMAVVPSVIGPLLLQGVLGVAATAIGTGLFDAGEQALGLPLSRKFKKILNFFRARLFRAAKKSPPQSALAARLVQPASSFSMTKRLAKNFRDAVSGKKPQQTAVQAYKPAFDGPTL